MKKSKNNMNAKKWLRKKKTKQNENETKNGNIYQK